MDPPPLRDFQALVDRAGGRARLLLVGEAREGEAAPRTLLESFARDLFAEPEPRKAQEAARGAQPDPPAGARRVRVRVGGSAARTCPPCALLFVLFGAASLAPPPGRARRERLRLREILRDVRSQLPSAAGPAVVGVVVLGAPPPGRPGEGEGEAARLQLDALLRQVFRRRRPGAHETLQAATYSPGAGQGAADARAAACRALRAALKLRADGAEAKMQRIPAFLQCIPWARRSRRKEGHLEAEANNFSEDAVQDPEEGLSLTNMAPNGNCEEACGITAT